MPEIRVPPNYVVSSVPYFIYDLLNDAFNRSNPVMST